MLKFIGFITKNMYYTQNKTMISPELKRYTIPLETIDILDINKTVYYNEDKDQIVIESLKDKGSRLQFLFILEQKEGTPIIGIDRYDGDFDDSEDEEETEEKEEEEDGRDWNNRINWSRSCRLRKETEWSYKPFGTNKNNEPIIIAKLKELGYFVTIEPKEEDFTVWKQDAEGRNYSKVIRLIGNKCKFSVHE